jgi:hypothetical protein
MSISRSHQHRAGFCALRVLSILGIAASLFALCRFASAEAPVITWAARVLADDAQPQWKRQFAQSAIDGDCVRFTARTTAYSDRDDLDPGTGGGIWGCTWIDPCGRKRPTPILKHGMSRLTLATGLREPSCTRPAVRPLLDRGGLRAGRAREVAHRRVLPGQEHLEALPAI